MNVFEIHLRLCAFLEFIFRRIPNELLASHGLLSVRRMALGQRVTKTTASDLFSVHYTNASRNDIDEHKKEKAYELIDELRTTHLDAIELWTDGSLQTTPKKWITKRNYRERVAVEFTGGWYTGITRAITNTSLINKFQRIYGSPPDFQINYDDGQSHVYKQKDKEIFDMIVDQDTKQDYQRIAQAIPENIGGAGAYVRLNDGTTIELSKCTDSQTQRPLGLYSQRRWVLFDRWHICGFPAVLWAETPRRRCSPLLRQLSE